MQPTLVSARLRLRPFTPSDVPAVQALAGHRLVAETTTTIPHPYPDGAAEAWIVTHAPAYAERRGLTYAVERRDTGELVGALSLMDWRTRHARAEVGYWTGVPHWGRGYGTEALCRLIPFAHETLGITRLVGHCLAGNPASARVLVKAGFEPEGRLVRHVWTHGQFHDLLVFGCVLPGRGAA